MKKFIAWLDNYWYHYKWPTIIVGFTALFVIIMLTQFVSRDEYDVTLIYAGPFDPDANRVRDVEAEFAKILPGDRDGDNKKTCQLTHFFLLSDEQIEEYNDSVSNDGEAYFVNRNTIKNTQQQFTNQVSAGDGAICLLDPYWYDLLRRQEVLVPLAEILDDMPDYAADEYSVRLFDTPFGGYFDALSAFPDDTVICFLRLSAASLFGSRTSAEERYEFDKQVLQSILSFAPQN